MIFKLIPGLKQLIHYKSSYFTGDVSAGMIVAVLLIPQSMAYAIIAGVPLEVGLYAATIPLIIYALFGDSKYLSVGPVSIVSLIAYSGVTKITQPDSSYFLELILLLGLMVGSIHLIMGFLKIGNLFKYISPTVISGFISAVAIIIILNQIKSIMGVSLPHYDDFFNYIIDVFHSLPQINLYTLTIGIGSIYLLLFFKKRTARSPGPILVVFLSTVFVYLFNLHKRGVNIVGEIPVGLPEFTFNMPTIHAIQLLLPVALIIAFLSFLESYAVVQTFADKEKKHLKSNQELIGLGLANIASSFVGSIPVAGALSRTAVNYQSGAKSNLSLLITAFFVMFSLLYLTPLFYYMPKATLAAIIIVAVANLIKLNQFHVLASTEPKEAFVLITTFFATLILDIFWGLIIGILLSIFLLLFRKFFANFHS